MRSYRTKGFILSITVLFFLLLFIYDVTLWMQVNQTRYDYSEKMLQSIMSRDLVLAQENNVDNLLRAAILNSVHKVSKFVANSSELGYPEGYAGASVGEQENLLNSDLFNYSLLAFSDGCEARISKNDSGTREKLLNNLTGSNVLSGYANKYNGSLSEDGFTFEISAHDCQLGYKDHKTLEATMNVSMTIASKDGKIILTKQAERTVEVPMDGLLDITPMLKMKDANPTGTINNYADDPPLHKIYFDSRIDGLDKLKPEVKSESTIINGAYGKGWAFGTVRTWDEIKYMVDNNQFSNLSSSILYMDSDERETIGPFEFNYYINKITGPTPVAGILLEPNTGSDYELSKTGTGGSGGDPDCASFDYYEASECIVPGFCVSRIGINTANRICDLGSYSDSYQEIPMFSGTGFDSYVGSEVLIYSPVEEINSGLEGQSTDRLLVKVMDIGNFRKAVLGMLYFKDENSPSFVQRHYENGADMKSNNYGIVGFVYSSDHTRIMNPDGDVVDHRTHQYPDTPETNFLIRGMPGCKAQWMCNTQPLKDSAGQIYDHFAIPGSLADQIGLDNTVECKQSYDYNSGGC